MDDKVRDIWFAVLFLIWEIVFVAYGLPALFLFGQGGIEISTNFDKVVFYSQFVIGFSIFLVLLKIIKMILKDFKLPTILHDPEDSVLSKIPIFKNIVLNPYLLLMFSILIFSGAFFLSISQQTYFTGRADLPNYRFEQQVTESAELGLSIFPASDAETMAVIAMSITMLMGLYLLKIKQNLNEFVYQVSIYLGIPMVIMMIGIVYHLARYGGSDIALISVAIFWFITGFLTVLFRSVIPPLVYHATNNFFSKAYGMFSIDILKYGLIGVSVLLFIAFIYFFYQSFQTKESKLNTI